MSSSRGSELGDFVKYSVSKGISKEDVKKMLEKNGWPKESIEKIFSKTKGKKGEVSAGKAVIRLANVTKVFGSNVVLDNVNLSIYPGDIFGIIGLSGSGKTTLLNSIIGFVEPDAGNIIIKSPADKKDYLLSKNPRVVKHFFGFAAQQPSFYGKLTVEENVNHFSSLYNIPKKERLQRCESLIRMVGLSKSKKVLGQNLSGGMQKRLDIACSLVHNPKVLILDEPTADLDPISREGMWDIIKEINSRGTTIVLASHFVNELEVLCSKFAILHNSKIVETGTPEELKTSYSKNYEISLRTVKIIKILKAKKGLEIQKVKEEEGMITVFTKKPEQTLYTLAKTIESQKEKIEDITVNKPTIKELFEAVVKK
jgi:ABC-2 type transport system ATP-binding protein